MATMNSVIEYVDRVLPNTFTDEDKYKWLRALNGRVAREIMGNNDACCTIPDDADKELLVPAPYDEVYSLYVMAQIELLLKEYDHYNNYVLAFKELLDSYKAWYQQNYPGRAPQNFRNVMG